MKTVFAVVSLVICLSGCISTNVKSYTDPDYRSTIVKSVVLDLNGLAPILRAEMEPSITQALTSARLKVTPISELISPTRDVPRDKVLEVIAQSGSDVILTMKVVDENERTTYAGSIGSATTSGYLSGNSYSGSTSGFSVPLVAARGETVMKATLFDAKTGRKVWVADLHTKASGTAYVGKPSKIASSASDALVDKLREDGRIAPIK